MLHQLFGLTTLGHPRKITKTTLRRETVRSREAVTGGAYLSLQWKQSTVLESLELTILFDNRLSTEEDRSVLNANLIWQWYQAGPKRKDILNASSDTYRPGLEWVLELRRCGWEAVDTECFEP